MALQDSLKSLNEIDFNDIDPNNLGSAPTAVKVILLVLVFAAVVGAGWYLSIVDKNDQLTKADKREDQLKQELNDKAFQAANLKELEDQRAGMQASLDQMVRQLPKSVEIPGLIEDIDATARNSGLTILTIQPEAEVPKEFYVEKPISITVQGSFHDLGTFVSGVANLSRIVTLHDFQIQPQGGPDNLRMTITALTYRYREDGEGA